MDELLKQIQLGMDNNLYMLSLFCSLTIPDICGAVESKNGESNSAKYQQWYDTYVFPYYQTLTSKECYDFRCRMLHQGQTIPKKQNYYSKIAFAEPKKGISIDVRQSSINGNPGPKCIDLTQFVDAILKGAERWLNLKKGTEPFEKNFKKCVQRYPKGLPYMVSGKAFIY